MARVIAGIYEIQEQIGAGGGGIVYLGRHIRLNKQIVLKADKRNLNTKPEVLRREVDMLKGLSHTYIPQVYDFVQEDGVVYTVMDFIDGESLDHLLKRGERLTQPQVILWACELLQALEYLHSQPPYGILHGDIKPANIMQRPNGDICLIDYNIALALGEDGAVRAGFSRGYASPEHYGIEYAGKSGNETKQSTEAGRNENHTEEIKKQEKSYQTEKRESLEALPESLEATETLEEAAKEDLTERLQTVALPEPLDPTENLETAMFAQPFEPTEALEGVRDEDLTENLETIVLSEASGATKMLETAAVPEATEVLETMVLPEATEVLETMVLPEATEVLETMVLPEATEVLETVVLPEATEVLETMVLPEATENLETAMLQVSAEPTEVLETVALSGQPDTISGVLAAESLEAAEKKGREEDKTEEKKGSISSGSTGSRSGVMLDVRSDIYSLGATLYHLLSGRRPAQDAREVEPLGPEICSPQISRILQKSMAVSPDMRYQTAGEMLEAFRLLHIRDERVVRRRKRARITAALLSVVFLSGGGSTFTGMKRMEQTQESLTLAEYSANRLAEGNVSGAIELALQAIPEGSSILEAPVTAQARKALTDALGVYDLSDSFKSLDAIELPSAPFTIVVSPDNSCFAAVYQYETAIFDMESREQIAVLPMQPSALAEVVFADKTHIIYAGEQGVTAYDLEKKEPLWQGEVATTLAISGDGTTVAAVNRDEAYAAIYRVSDGEKLTECSFGGQHMEVAVNDIFANPHNRIFSLNEKGDMLAVSFAGGGLQIFDLARPDEDLIIFEENDEAGYDHYEGGFCGRYFAFAADKSDESLFGLVDTEEGVYVGGYDSKDNFFLKTDAKGIYLANGNLLVKFDPETLEEMELAYTNEKNITGFAIGEEYVLTTADDNTFSFYDGGANLVLTETNPETYDFAVLAGEYAVLAGRNGPSVRLMKKKGHEEARLASYDARYLHDEARISQDKKTSMLFKYEDFRIYDRDGQMVAQMDLPDPEYIYDQQFRRTEEDSWLEVIWYDGTVRNYSATDGSLIKEEKKEPPSKDLEEEFYTDRYRIVSTLHGAPEVYDQKTNKKIAELEEDAYLTYVTQTEEYIITEYVSAAGERYGLLLDDRLQTVAYLPMLCDIMDGMLVFDYGSGDLRQCRLYSLQELTALGELYLQQTK